MFDLQPITITPKAAEEVRKIMQTKNIPSDYGLRVGVRGSGCGTSLLIGFDKRKETDQSYNSEGRGFMFTDPQAERSAETSQ
jgi:iron-sulfur cluster assembly protein